MKKSLILVTAAAAMMAQFAFGANVDENYARLNDTLDTTRHKTCASISTFAVAIVKHANEAHEPVSRTAQRTAEPIEPALMAFAKFGQEMFAYWFPDGRAVTSENAGMLRDFLTGYCYARYPDAAAQGQGPMEKLVESVVHQPN